MPVYFQYMLVWNVFHERLETQVIALDETTSPSALVTMICIGPVLTVPSTKLYKIAPLKPKVGKQYIENTIFSILTIPIIAMLKEVNCHPDHPTWIGLIATLRELIMKPISAIESDGERVNS